MTTPFSYQCTALFFRPALTAESPFRVTAGSTPSSMRRILSGEPIEYPDGTPTAPLV